jgi:D-amino peptidase
MKILIFNDMEGPSGIDSREMLADKELYKKAKEYATADVNAAIRGVQKANPKATIDVFDGHGMGDNLLVDQLTEGTNYLGGGWMTTFYELVQKNQLRDYSAVLLLGQHAGEGTANGFISHTNTGMAQLQVNGQFSGEAPQLAWLFGHFGVPTPLVVGDDAVCREATALLPGIRTVAVKQAKSRFEATSLPLDEAHARIELATFDVLSKLDSYPPYTVPGSVTIKITYYHPSMAETHAKFPNTTRTSPNAVQYLAENYLEGWLAYNISRVIIENFRTRDFLQFLKTQQPKKIDDQFQAYRAAFQENGI